MSESVGGGKEGHEKGRQKKTEQNHGADQGMQERILENRHWDSSDDKSGTS